jgi:hypothetical protein
VRCDGDRESFEVVIASADSVLDERGLRVHPTCMHDRGRELGMGSVISIYDGLCVPPRGAGVWLAHPPWRNARVMGRKCCVTVSGVGGWGGKAP